MKNKYMFLGTLLFLILLCLGCNPSTNTGGNGNTSIPVIIPIVYSNSGEFTIDTVTLGLEKVVSVGNGIYKKTFYSQFNVERTKDSEFKVFDLIYDTITVTQVILNEKFKISYVQTDSLLQVKLEKGYSNGKYHYIYPDDSHFPKEFNQVLK